MQDKFSQPITDAMLRVANDIAQRMVIREEASSQKYLNQLQHKMLRLYLNSGWDENSPDLYKAVDAYVNEMDNLIAIQLVELRRYISPGTRSVQ